MFSFLKKDPVKALEKQYSNILSEAMQQQRKGDIRAYSELITESEKLAEKLDLLKKQSN